METTRIGSVRNSVRDASVKAQTSLRSQPAKWTGIALGAGVGAGLVSRYLLHRSHVHHRGMPEVIVIGGVC